MSKGYIPGIGSGGGDSGETPNPPAGTLDPNEMLKRDATTDAIVGTGDTNTDTEVDFGSKDVRCKSVITESASVEVGPNLTISERGGYQQNHTNAENKDFISVDYEIDDTGTQKPLYDKRDAVEVRFVSQADDSQTMLNVTSYSLTPDVNNDVIALYSKFVNPVTNFRFMVQSDLTGLPIHYYPSENDWRKGTGVSIGVGENRAELSTPLAEESTTPITVFAMADQSIDVLGDGVNPWRAIDRQIITQIPMLDETDISKYEREIFISNDAGDDANDGLSLVKPKKTINSAISAANSLSPPPSVSNRVSITDLGTSKYELPTDITFSNGIIINTRASSIKGDSGVAVEVNTDCALVVGRLEPGDSDGSTAVRMGGSRGNITATSIIIGEVGVNQIGVRVVAAETNVNVDSLIANSTGCILLVIDGVGANNQPVFLDRMVMNAENCTAIDVSTTSGEPIMITAGLISDAGNAGCLGLNVTNGDVKLNVIDMSADVNIATGNTVAMNITRMEDTNTITVDAGAVLNIWCVEGEPAIVNNGVINGYIGGIYYGEASAGHYSFITADSLVANKVHNLYVDPTAAEVTVTLQTKPVLGENKKVWMPNNLNPVKFVSESPTYPVAPPAQIAPANLQAQWILDNDWLDNFDNNHDLALQGAGGAFSPIAINGNLVNGFDFQQSVYLEATGYAGILGNSARSFSTWYRASAGQPVADETLISWGEDIPNGGGSYWEVELRGAQGYLWVNNRNASRRYNFTGGLAAANLFDGNPHHIGVMQANSNMGSVTLLIDGVAYTHDFQDTFPSCNTLAGNFLKVGAGYNGLQLLNATLYDTRIWNRGLSTEEMIQVMNQELSGGLTITGAPNNFVFDMTWNGVEWIFGDGLPLYMQESRARIEALEAGQVDIIENYPTDATDPNLKLVPDTLGNVEWVIDPLGVTFDSNLALTGSEAANRFVYVGNGNVSITLPPSASTTLDYTIFIENKGEANGTVTVLLDGADTLTGGNSLAIGDGSTVTKTTATNYNSDLVTPATTSTIDALEDVDIALGTVTSAIFGAGKKVEDALEILSIDALVAVTSDATLDGAGTLADPLSVADPGITPAQHRKMYGYDIHSDNTTSGTAYSAADGVKTLIPNNAATEMQDLDPSIPHLIGPTGGALLDQTNALYSIGVQFTAEPAVRDKDYYILFEIPNGVSPGVNLQIAKRFIRFAKNLKEETISMSFVLPCTPSIVNKEILPYIETDGTSCDFWATNITVTKINGPIIP